MTEDAPPIERLTVERLTVERLTADGIRDNVALARAVGWQDAESDWRVLHEAAIVLGVRREGRLVGQGALGLYGEAGTIAKMIVAPELQGQRLGGRLLDALLEEAEQRSMRALGLVATDAGRPLYERRGFGPVGEIVVSTGTPEATGPVASTVRLADADAAVRVEKRWMSRWMSCSRASLLRARFREAIARSASVGAEGRLSGYAMATAQGATALIGPVVAESEDDARVLTAMLVRTVPGPARIDVPAEQHGFRQWLARIGFREQGVRLEMARGAPRLPWQVPQRFALASQAWG